VSSSSRQIPAAWGPENAVSVANVCGESNRLNERRGAKIAAWTQELVGGP
jgi:hypothetical protein